MKELHKGILLSIILISFSILLIILFLLSPDRYTHNLRNYTSNQIEQYFLRIGTRLETKREINKLDEVILKNIYHSMILYSYVVYPEAAIILKHYLSGKGGCVKVSASYLKNSPVVKKAIRNKDNCTVGPIALYIKEDPRLAYAFNRFYIDITTDSTTTKYKLYQQIEFDTLKKGRGLYTTFYIGKLSFKMKDNLVRIYEKNGGCKPFIAFCSWYK